MRKTIGVRVPKTDPCVITKASEASWSYSCDSKVSFNRVQILTPDFSGRRPPPSPPSLLLSPHPSSPHLPPSPPPCLPPIFPPSLLPLRKFHSVLSSLFGMRLALRILRPHSLTLTLTLSLSHCLTVSLISLISLISLSSLSLQEDPGKEPHIKDSSPLPPERAPCFFLPRCPPLSHSGALAFAPPWPQVIVYQSAERLRLLAAARAARGVYLVPGSAEHVRIYDLEMRSRRWLLGIRYIEAIATRVEAIATRVEAIATRVERVEAIATRVEAIATRVEAIATIATGHRY